MPNWKAPEKDGVQGYWLKNLTILHPRIAVQLSHIPDGEKPLQDWMTFGKTVLCQKDTAKGSATDNYRPISYLPLMWKLMTGMLAETVYSHLKRENVIPSEQNGCHKGSPGTKDKLLTDNTVFRDSKKGHQLRQEDYKKAYDMVPHSWISESLEMFGLQTMNKTF